MVLLAFLAGVGGGTVSSTFVACARTNSVTATQFVLQDGAGRTRAQIGMSAESSPTLFFFDTNGRVRLNMGTYGDGTPFVCLNDENQQAVALLRVAGRNGAPVLVEKLHGQDRLILGLSLNDASGDPFLWYARRDGSPINLFGKFAR